MRRDGTTKLTAPVDAIAGVNEVGGIPLERAATIEGCYAFPDKSLVLSPALQPASLI